MNLDPRKADQIIRGNVFLPHGTGKDRKVCVFVPPELQEECLKAGYFFFYFFVCL